MADISLWLDDYDDIYSDFDSRQYPKRRISEDFIYEMKDAFNYRKEKIRDLFLFMPPEKRVEASEEIIVTGMTHFFNGQFLMAAGKYRKKWNRGILLGIIGLAVMICSASLTSIVQNPSFLKNILYVLLEPGGWFLLWASFDTIYYDLKELKADKDFFKELAATRVHFRSS